MRKKYKGSAILWAVCSLLVISFIITGLLAVNKAYAAEEILNISHRQAEYYARSAVEMTAELIESKVLSDTDIDITMDVIEAECIWKGVDDDWFEKYVKDEVEKRTKNKRIKIEYDFEGNKTEVEIERIGDVMMQLRATSAVGNSEKTVIGIMEYKYHYQKWSLKGYVTY